jgi:CubicO group peptidase (beta-lactamase class C family)
MHSRFYVLTAAFVLAAVPFAQAIRALQLPPEPPAPPRTIQELEQRIREVLTRTHTPGIALALVRHDRILYTGGIGLADVASGQPATAGTLFRVGSTSKAFTALAVLQLQEEGKLRLDDPLRKHVPEIAIRNAWEATDPVRIVNALEHTAGFDDWSLATYARSDPRQLPMKDALDLRDPGVRVSRWRPGTRMAYSNEGPPLNGYILEKIEGKPFERVIGERVFEPLGMCTATYFHPDTTVAPMATLYENDGRTPRPYWYPVGRAAGSVNASAEDMAKYVRFLLDRGVVNGRRLLSVASMERLERSETWLGARAGLTVGYGLHMARYVDSGFVWTGHDGGVPGGLTVMSYMPDHQVGYAFMTNTGNHTTSREIDRLVRGYMTSGIPRPPLPVPAPMPPDARSRLAGWYRPDSPRAQHMYFIDRLVGLTRVTADDSSLVLRGVLGGTTRYLPVTAATFRGEREPVATLAFVDDSADGRPLAIERVGYMVPSSFVRVATPVVLTELTLIGLWVVAVVATIVAASIGAARLVMRRRGSPGSGWSWRVVIGATASLLIAFTVVGSVMIGNPTRLARPNLTSVTSYILFLLFAGLALAGLVVTSRARVGSDNRTAAASLWISRGAAVLNAIVAAYLTYWGLIGWRTWA